MMVLHKPTLQETTMMALALQRVAAVRFLVLAFSKTIWLTADKIGPRHDHNSQRPPLM